MRKRTIISICLLSQQLMSETCFAADGIDKIDNAFVLMSAMLVLLMSIPGIGLFYGGLTRAKNVLSTIEQTLAVFCTAIILWMIVGYSIAFGNTKGFLGDFFGGFENIFLNNLTYESVSGTLSTYTYIIFQGAFCAISACLIVGATVERIKFSAILIVVSFYIIFSYAPLAHQIWGGGFIDTTFASYDFAGGVVVHINAAVCGLTGAYMLGRRHDLGKVVMTPHNISYAYRMF